MAEKRVQRRLAAILAADVVGYSRMMREDEAGTLAQLKVLRKEVFDPRTAEHSGRIVKTTGDGVLVEFASAVDATECAVKIQRVLARRNEDVPEGHRFELRIGINLGDVIVDGDDIYGDGVNVASRIEGLAEPGSVCISGSVHEQVKGKLDMSFDDLGPQQVKNIADPVRVYRAATTVAAADGDDRNSVIPVFNLPSIAVLPFDNLSGDPEQEYFSDGITEDLITALSHVRRFRVVARNSTFSYKGTSPDVRRVAEDLEARYVIEGSVRKAGSRIRVTAQLIEGDSGKHIWAERYDRDLEDIFAVQDELTMTLVGAITPGVGKAEQQRARQKPHGNLDAWDLYQRGMWHFRRRDRGDIDEAQALFERALLIDPEFAPAYTGCARAFYYRALYGFEEDDKQRALTAAAKAVELEGSDAEAHVALSRVYNIKRDHEAATSEAKALL